MTIRKNKHMSAIFESEIENAKSILALQVQQTVHG